MRKILDDLLKDRRSEILIPSWIFLAIFLLLAGFFLFFELPDIGGGGATEEPAGNEEPPAADELPAAEELAADIVWLTGSQGSEPGQFIQPLGLLAHPSGDIYVSDLGNARLQRLTGAGAFLGLWPAPEAASPSLAQPSDVAVDGAGDVYALDASGAVYKLEPDGRLTEAFALAPLGVYFPRGLGVDAVRDRFYVADTGGARVLVIGRDGSLIDDWGPHGEDALPFQQPWGIAVDREGNVFVAEKENSRVRKISPDGVVLAEWIVDGVVSDLALGPDDRVYITADDRALLWVYDSGGKMVGHVTTPFRANSLGPASGVAVVGPGDVIMGTVEGVIVRASIHFQP